MSLVDPNTPAGTQPRGLSGFGSPVFSDEFQGTELDDTKWYPWYPDVPFWNTTTPGGHKTNSNEPQGYDESGISFPGDGTMRFNMRESNVAVPELPFSSGMVSSGDKFSQTYGVFEARIKVPHQAGSWSAFWLFPAANLWEYEIDIMESWGSDGFNWTTLHTVHTRLSASQSAGYNVGETVGNSYHTYTLWWEPDRIRMFVDGNLALDFTEDEIGYIYEKPMYVQLNLAGAVGADGRTNLERTAPFDMEVSYVRVWQNSPNGQIDPFSIPPVNPGGVEPEPEPNPETSNVVNSNGEPVDIYRLNGTDIVKVNLT